MKFLNFQAFAELAELTARANGKTQEAVRFSLNFLFSGLHRSVLYIGNNQESCIDARRFAEEMVKSRPEYGIEIKVNNRYGIQFFSGAGTSHLLFNPYSTAHHSIRGRTLDEIIFHVDPETLFKGSQKEDGKFKDLFYSVAPTMAHRRNSNAQLKQFF